jgi:hypothetical protein
MCSPVQGVAIVHARLARSLLMAFPCRISHRPVLATGVMEIALVFL